MINGRGLERYWHLRSLEMYIVKLGRLADADMLLPLKGPKENKRSGLSDYAAAQKKFLPAFGNVKQQPVLSAARTADLPALFGKNMPAAYKADTAYRLRPVKIGIDAHVQPSIDKDSNIYEI